MVFITPYIQSMCIYCTLFTVMGGAGLCWRVCEFECSLKRSKFFLVSHPHPRVFPGKYEVGWCNAMIQCFLSVTHFLCFAIITPLPFLQKTVSAPTWQRPVKLHTRPGLGRHSLKASHAARQCHWFARSRGGKVCCCCTGRLTHGRSSQSVRVSMSVTCCQCCSFSELSSD